jgi:hypothetical protein
MYIYLPISNISIITGDNKWKSLKDFTIELWKKYNFSNYYKTKKSFDNYLKMSQQNNNIKKIIKSETNSLNIDDNVKNFINKSLNNNIINKSIKQNIIKNINSSNNSNDIINKLNVNKDVKNIIKQEIKNIKNFDTDKLSTKLIKDNITKSVLLNDKKNNKNNIDDVKKNINEITKIINNESKIESIKRKINSCNEINSNNIECKKKFIKTESDSEKIKRIEKEQNINLSSKLSIKSNNTQQLQKNTNNILKNIDSTKLSEKEKNDIKKSAINLSNQYYGTSREKFTVDYLYKNYNLNVVIDKKCKRKYILNQFYIVGEIDGILNNDTIIEIKNRTKRLFYRLYNYEKVQISMYMFLCNLSKSKLVENYNNNINIIDFDQDDIFLQNILEKIYKFINFYNSLLDNIDFKRITLLGNDIEFNKFYNNL